MPVWSAGSWAWGRIEQTDRTGWRNPSHGSLSPACVCLCRSEIGTALRHSQFGSGSGIFHYERLGCRGDEDSLRACRSRTFVTGDCSHGNEAAVVCAPPEGQCDFSTTWTGARCCLKVARSDVICIIARLHVLVMDAVGMNERGITWWETNKYA